MVNRSRSLPVESQGFLDRYRHYHWFNLSGLSLRAHGCLNCLRRRYECSVLRIAEHTIGAVSSQCRQAKRVGYLVFYCAAHERGREFPMVRCEEPADWSECSGA